MGYEIVSSGESRSFPAGDPFLAGSTPGAAVMLYLGTPHKEDTSKAAILVELDIECLGVHTGEDSGREGSNVLGFARFRNGGQPPSNLIELVRQPNTPDSAVEAARAVFETAGFDVVVCADQAGRILDRLTRPKYNNALRFLDEGLAEADAMDLTCRLGLGYAKGPIEQVVEGGLDRHYDISKALFDVTGSPGYAPARRAAVAKLREEKS